MNDETQGERQEVEPVFEVVIRSAIAVEEPKYRFRIWGDGRIEGFEGLGASAEVINRFPLMLDQLLQPVKDWVEDVDRAIDDLASKEG